MSRRPLRAALLALAPLAVSAAAHAQVPAPTGPARPALAATVTTCTPGVAPADRSAVFTGSMPQDRRATTMGMRFELQARPEGADAFTRVKLPAFGTPVRSEPGVSGFVYAKRVEQLAPGSSYRVVVQYRWYDAKGTVVRRARRTSAVCRQPDLRPDLRVTRILVGAAQADGSAPYLVTVRNDGESAAPRFTTSLLVGGTLLPVAPLGGLAPGATATVGFRAPRCAAGAPVVATVDAGGAVDEADEADDVSRSTCPAV